MKIFGTILLLCIVLCSNYAFSQDCPDSCSYFIPNNITPDCDSYDCGVLEIATNCTFTNYEFFMFDRWGETIFQSTDPEIKFYCGDHKEGTYTWKLKGQFCNSMTIDDTGQLLILR